MTTAADIIPEAVERFIAVWDERRPNGVMSVRGEVVHAHDYDSLAAMLRALAAERDALRSALTDAQEIARRGDDIILELEKKLDAARSSLTASGEALREYGHHKNSCRFISNVPNPGIRPGSCTCGLESAMEKANG